MTFKPPIRKANFLFREEDQIDLGGGVIWIMSARNTALFGRTPKKPQRIAGRAALQNKDESNDA